jgi:hypothetical protein
MSQLSLGVMRFTGRAELSAGLPRAFRLPRVADRPGANWGARSRRALALAGTVCPQRAIAGPVTGVLRRRAVGAGEG